MKHDPVPNSYAECLAEIIATRKRLSFLRSLQPHRWKPAQDLNESEQDGVTTWVRCELCQSICVCVETHAFEICSARKRNHV